MIYTPLLKDHGPRRILDLHISTVAVNWLCISQLIPFSAQEPQYQPRPQRYWSGTEEISKLIVVRSTAEHITTVGDTVVFKDRSMRSATVATVIEDENEWTSDALAGWESDALTISSTRTKVKVLFQDGTVAEGVSILFEHCELDEDVDSFPGEIGLCSSKTPPALATVQTMDYLQRTIEVRWMEDGTTEIVSALEYVLIQPYLIVFNSDLFKPIRFDPNGPASESYGIGRHDRCLISNESTGALLPSVATLGESEILAGNFPAVGGPLRSTLHSIYASGSQSINSTLLPTPQAALDSINFYGEVVDLLLDGTVLIRFPSGREEAFALDRLYRLDDGMDGEGSEDGDLDQEMMGLEAEQDELKRGGWMSDEEEVGMIGSDAEGDAGDVNVLEEEMNWESSVDGDGSSERGWDEDENSLELAEAVSSAGVIEVHNIVLPPQEARKQRSMPVEEEDSQLWQRYILLDEAPKVGSPALPLTATTRR